MSFSVQQALQLKGILKGQWRICQDRGQGAVYIPVCLSSSSWWLLCRLYDSSQIWALEISAHLDDHHSGLSLSLAWGLHSLLFWNPWTSQEVVLLSERTSVATLETHRLSARHKNAPDQKGNKRNGTWTALTVYSAFDKIDNSPIDTNIHITNGGSCHARCRPAHWEQIGVLCLTLA